MLDSQKEALLKWLSTDNGKPKTILVYGPTASGKSKLAVEVAYFLKGYSRLSPFIISVDARQIYKGLNIGTGKTREEEMM